VDPQILELVKALIAPGLTGGGVLGFYLLYRKFEAERATSLREDNKTLRDENKDLREELRKSEEDRDKLRAKVRGEDV
jgi:cell division protein FtsB